ncbi:MAG: glycosyltransferase, partial [Candidatus Roizmanbacteria bacterium]
KFVGFVEDEDLPYLYNGCRAFIYLSKYEGFGLPPVEAASCGKMVLMYENSSLKEIFNQGYPFTKEGSELKTLQDILAEKYDIKKYRKEFSWKNYCIMFLKILND